MDCRLGKITSSGIGPFAIAERQCGHTVAELKGFVDDYGIECRKSATKGELLGILEEALPPRDYDSLFRHSKGTIDARSTLYAAKIAELSGTELPDEYDNYATIRGNALEPEARRMFEFIGGEAIEEVGFVEHDNGLFGCSPDGLIMSPGDKGGILSGVEIKCHLPKAHAKFLLDPDSFVDAHEYQVHWMMAICECDFWNLFGYCPRLPYIHKIVERGGLTERLLDSIGELAEEYKAAIDQYNSIFAEQRARIAALREGAAA